MSENYSVNYWTYFHWSDETLFKDGEAYMKYEGLHNSFCHYESTFTIWKQIK